MLNSITDLIISRHQCNGYSINGRNGGQFISLFDLISGFKNLTSLWSSHTEHDNRAIESICACHNCYLGLINFDFKTDAEFPSTIGDAVVRSINMQRAAMLVMEVVTKLIDKYRWREPLSAFVSNINNFMSSQELMRGEKTSPSEETLKRWLHWRHTSQCRCLWCRKIGASLGKMANKNSLLQKAWLYLQISPYKRHALHMRHGL